MKKIIYFLTIALLSFVSCERNIQEESIPENPTFDYLAVIKSLGFDESSAVDMGEFFIVEEDIMLSKDELPKYGENSKTRQAHANFIVSESNVSNIKIKIDSSLNGTLPNGTSWRNVILEAMQHYNDLGSAIYMSEVSSNADMTISKGAIDAWGTSTFPLADGSVGPSITLSDNVNTSKLTHSQKVFLVIHEMGHTLGFRHTDYLTAYPPYAAEGENVPGAHHIYGTPTGTVNNQDPNSVFNSGNYYGGAVISWKGFSEYDVIAINTLYPLHLSLSIIGNNIISSFENVSYTLQGLPGNSVVSWSVGNEYLKIVSSSSSSVTVKRSYRADGNSSLSAKITIGTTVTVTESKSISLSLIDGKDNSGIYLTANQLFDPRDNKRHPFSDYPIWSTGWVDLTGYNFYYGGIGIHNTTKKTLSEMNMFVLFQWKQDGKLVHKRCQLMKLSGITSGFSSWSFIPGRSNTEYLGVPSAHMPRISASSTDNNQSVYTYVIILYSDGEGRWNVTGMPGLKLLRKSGIAPDSGWIY